MAVPQTQQPQTASAKQSTTTSTSKNGGKKIADSKVETLLSKAVMLTPTDKRQLAEEHLPPLFLTFVVLLCTGCLLVVAIRDFMTTGRAIAGPWDEAVLRFTRSTDWYDDSKGWKSKQGGFSVVSQMTTDSNNMGGFFVRKMAGAASLVVQLQKLAPLLVPVGAGALRWNRGHYRPLLATALVANLCLALFYASYLSDFAAADAQRLPQIAIALLLVESLVFAYYLLVRLRPSQLAREPPVAVALKEGKTPESVPSRIVARTVLLVSSATALVAGRDLFFPGSILEFLPRDDIYLEWTNALRHSPPPGSPEDADVGLEAPFFAGDKYVSQFLAVNLLLMCLYKVVSSCFLRYNSDGSGFAQALMFWKVQAVGDGLLLFVFRIFTSAAGTASLDLRWHLMLVAYEAFILALYGYF